MREVDEPKGGLTEPGEKPKVVKPAYKCPCTCNHEGTCNFCVRANVSRR